LEIFPTTAIPSGCIITILSALVSLLSFRVRGHTLSIGLQNSPRIAASGNVTESPSLLMIRGRPIRRPVALGHSRHRLAPRSHVDFPPSRTPTRFGVAAPVVGGVLLSNIPGEAMRRVNVGRRYPPPSRSTRCVARQAMARSGPQSAYLAYRLHRDCNVEYRTAATHEAATI
jgi:hypothetical protein